ncbi:MAG: EAL domain-containing protein [Caulobacterales bacterium]|nr:EAL domain-containing protein [Caulobacterales bacterium]
MSKASRFISFAFAASDLLVELDGQRRIAFAAGATATSGDDPRHQIGRTLDSLLGRRAAWSVRRALNDIRPGQRLGPIDVLVPSGTDQVRPASVRGFQAPGMAPSVSLGIRWEGAAFAAPADTPELLTADAFLASTRAVMSDLQEPASVAFVELTGLAGVGSETARQSVEAVLRDAAVDGQTAARLTDERFAVLRAGDDERSLIDLVMAACTAENLPVTPQVSEEALDPSVASPPMMRALRFALSNCIEQGLESTGNSFSDQLARTLKEAEQFGNMVRNRAFDLHYQPIVDLKTRAVHHHEVLSRFKANDTAWVIRMAEELDMIRAFDLAVMEKSLRTLQKPGAGLIKLAINVSGASLTDDAYVDTLLKRTALNVDDRKRLLIEVTETAALEDMDAVGARLQRLRQAGIKLCIDDFGSGAASYEYLRRLPVDVVKLDGQLTRSVEDERTRTMLAHLVELCRTLSVKIVAEQVETQATADTLVMLGVDLGQGWLWARPSPDPIKVIPELGGAARRAGTVASWG